MKRKFLSLILVFAMTVSLLTVGTGAVEPTYGDTAGHWAESSIERWSAYGIIQGSNGQFDPNGQLTCAQLATILAKLLKLPAAKDGGFTDNTADAWYYDAINRCAAAGILNGNGDGTVTPEAPITRERAMVMLARALGIEPIRKPDLTKYTDAAQVSAYAQGYVAALIEAGIVGGVTADELAPQANINRASTVTILDRAISTYADQAGATVKADGKGIVLVVAENVKITNAPEGTKIVVADGATGLTVNGKSVSDDQTYIVPKTTPGSGSSSGGYSHSHSYNETTHKCSCGEFAPDVVATIGDETGYLTLEAAVAAAQSGDIVKLVKDANMTDTIHIKDGKEITLALNNHNVSITEQGKFIRVCNAELTVTGPGAVKEMHSYYSPILIKGGPAGSANYSVVNVGSGVTLEGWAGVFIDQNNGNNYGIALNVNEATLNSVNDVSGYSGSAVYVNGSITNENNMPKITLTNATLEATGAGMYLAGYADTTISGGSIAGAATAIEIRAGKLTLNGGSYTASAETYSCDPNGNGTTTSGAALAIAQHTTKKNINVMISGGTFTGVRALSESNPQANDPAPEVTLSITDGTFNGDVTIADEDHTSIAGGTFSTEPANEYIAKGYTKERDNGKWNVVPDTSKTYVAQVGVNKYVSLPNALAAAKNGDTVKLVGNISTDKGIEVAKKITLDMAEHTITSSVNQVFTVTGSGDLTITGNGTIAGPTEEAAKDLDSKAVLMVSGESAKLTVLNGTITAGGVGDCGMYGIYVADGGNVILGDANTKTGPTITTWFAAVGENNTTSPANITIYGGEYTAQAAPADSDWWAYFCAPVYASASGDINISGGTFNGYYGISSRYVNVGQNLNISGGTFNGSKSALFADTQTGTACDETRTIAITGGTFSSNPSAYVADGYVAMKNDNGTWTVIAPTAIENGVTIKGIAGYERYAFSTISEAYAEISPKVAALGGLGQETCLAENFNAFYTDNGKITWTIYGKQTLVGKGTKDSQNNDIVVDNYTLTFGRAASYYGDRSLTKIEVKAGNESAALDLSATNGTFALPYNWWGQTVKNIEISFAGIIFDGIKSIPGTWATPEQETPYTFDHCTFNGNIYGYHDYNINLTIKNSTFNAPDSTQYAIMLQSTTGISGKVTLDNNTFNNYTRGVNFQRPGTTFLFTNNTIKSTVVEPDRGVIQLTDGKQFVVTGNIVDVNVGNAFWFHDAATNSDVTYTINNNNIKAAYIGYSGVTSFNVNDKITFSSNIFNNTDTTKCMKKGATVAEATNLTAIH